jgi:hypothetical protein
MHPFKRCESAQKFFFKRFMFRLKSMCIVVVQQIGLVVTFCDSLILLSSITILKIGVIFD